MMLRILCILLLAGSVCLLAPSVSGEIIDDLISYWKMDDASGDAIDAHASNDGTCANISYEETGKIGTSFGLNGSSSNVNVGDIAAIDNATALSVSCWVYHDDLDADDYIMTNRSTGAGFLFLRDNVGSVTARTDMYKIYVSDATGADVIEGASNSSPVTTWTHVVFTYEPLHATGLHLYINGTEDANSPGSTNNTDDIDPAAVATYMGSNSQESAWYDGKIDEVGVWEKVLTSSEVTALYNGGAGLAYPLAEEAANRRIQLLKNVGGR